MTEATHRASSAGNPSLAGSEAEQPNKLTVGLWSRHRKEKHMHPEEKMGPDLIRHMGEFSIFVPFVGVFVCIVILIVCCSKGRRGKTTSDIESKVLTGELQS